MMPTCPPVAACSTCSRRPRAARGLTLVELLLATLLMGMIGLTITGMLTAVTYGTGSAKDIRSLVGRGKAVQARISAAIRSSAMVLDQGDSHLVLWIHDEDQDEAPGLLEIRRIDYDADAGTITSYLAPLGTPESYYTLDDDFKAVTDALMGTDDFPAELWASGVEAWTCSLDDPDPRAATLVSYQVLLRSGDLTDAAIGAVSLRN